MIDFQQIPHTADVQLRVQGATKQELFAHALEGMFQILSPRGTGCREQNGCLTCTNLPRTHTITVTAPDEESLLVDFLSAALCLSDTHHEAYLKVTFHELSATSLHATVHGIAITGFDVVEIKAVTHHLLAIKKIEGGWQTDIVFDI